jgi:small-conductance mechanosensitive channel
MKPEMRAMDAVHIMVAKIAAALPAIGSGVMVMLAFLLAAWLLRMLIRRFVPESHPNAARLIGILVGTVFWSIVLLGVVCGLGTMGVDVGALIAGLGLGGLAIGLAVKDAVSNAVSGVLILIYRPFSYGSRISVAGVPNGEGKVVSIDLRYTTLENEGNRTFVPNQTMFSNAVTVIHEAPTAAARPA